MCVRKMAWSFTNTISFFHNGTAGGAISLLPDEYAASSPAEVESSSLLPHTGEDSGDSSSSSLAEAGECGGGEAGPATVDVVVASSATSLAMPGV